MSIYNSLDTTVFQKTGDYNLSPFINIISYDYDTAGADLKRLNIHNLVVELNIFESIDQPFISGHIIIADATDIFSQINMIGFERLEFKLATPGFDRHYDFTTATGTPLFIYKVSKRIQISENAQGYMLSFTSMERIKSETRLISRSYNDNFENIVNDILRRDLDSKKSFFYEKSKSLHKMVFPTRKPLSIIQHLAENTRSSAHNGAGYKFYETSVGFNFRSIECMTNVKSRTPRSPIATYHLGRKNVRGGGDKQLISDMTSMENFEISQQTNSLKNMMEGVYASEMVTHDLFTKQIRTNAFNYFINRDDTSQMNSLQDLDSGIIPRFTFEQNKTPANMPSARYFKSVTTKLHNNATQPPSEEIDMKRNSKDGAMRNTVAKAIIPGFLGVSAGDVLGVNVPAYDHTKPGAIDSRHSGSYLVTELRHHITKGNTDRHLCHLTLQKDDYATAYPVEEIDSFTENRDKTQNYDFDLYELDEELV
tara:strand:- start:393 stop:1835 length:1443 start_codon:yes stop_codon:yes gene_type:complete